MVHPESLLFHPSIHWTIVHTMVEINKACPTPKVKPVIKRKVFVLFLHFHNWVKPSIIIGIAITNGIHKGTIRLARTAIGVNKYPSKIAKHLVQSCIGFPLICKQRSGMRWQGMTIRISFIILIPFLRRAIWCTIW